jgi:hypothetical protein
MELSCTTELEALNSLLGAVGETPVSTLEDLGFTDASVALAILRTTSRETQSKGWYFNRDYTYYFTPAADGSVVLPPNVLSIRPSTVDGRRIVPRGDLSVTQPAIKLWNSTDGTFTYAADAGPTVEVVWMFDFELLPETARRYITVRAATLFQAQYQGNEQANGFSKDDERFALFALTDEERLYEPRANFFNDSQGVSEVFTR